jgi:hypothetical protein
MADGDTKQTEEGDLGDILCEHPQAGVFHNEEEEE